MATTSEGYPVYNRSINHGLTETIDALMPGELLLTHRSDDTVTQIGRTAMITENAAYKNGREDAISGIYFADITLQTASGYESEQPVAIKPLGTAWKVSEEIRKAYEINDLSVKDRPQVSSSPITFMPLGAYRDGSTGKICAITRFEQGVESFDNVFKYTNDTEPLGQIDRMFALANAAEGLIFLHENGYIHTDYQVKNTAADTIGTRIIDITAVRKHRRYNVPDISAFIEDVSLYIYSLWPHTDARASTVDIVTEHFVELYRQHIKDIYPETLHSAVNFSLDNINVGKLLSGNKH